MAVSVDTKTRVKLDGLEKIRKALGRSLPEIRVGILGENASRENEGNSGLTNAQVGAFHEFGTSKLPVRSFLRMPLSLFLKKRLEAEGILSDENIKQVIASGNVRPLLEQIAVVAEAVVLEGFATGGYGKWAPTKNMGRKKVQQTLVETGQLRDSITSEVK